MHPIFDVFRPEHSAAFAALNRAWLVEYRLLEPPDELQLNDPQGQIIDAGGQIFVALDNVQVIGTCAVVPHGDGMFEIAKLAVSPEAKGQGIGRRLVEVALAYTRERGAHRVVLLSNSQLQTAIRLYEEIGFRHCPVPAEQPYASADVYMELDLMPT